MSNGQEPLFVKIGGLGVDIMDISFLQFSLISLAVFRLTRLIVYDKITYFIRSPFMMDYEVVNQEGEKEIYVVPKEGGVRGWVGELLSCYWCTGVWVAIGVFCLLFFCPTIGEPLILILAIAGAAAIVETIIQYFLYDNE